MKSASLTIALLAAALFASVASAAPFVAIGVQFRGGTGQNGDGAGSVSLLPTQVAGVPGVQQSNFNVMTGYNFLNNQDTTGHGYLNPSVLVNSLGQATTATITATGAGTYGNAGSVTPALDATTQYADEILNSGLLNGGGTGQISVTVNNIPTTFARYDLYLYTSNDVNRGGSTSLTSVAGAPTYYVTAPGAAAQHGYVDGDPTTPYTYLQGTSTDSAHPTNGADYVVYTGLTASSLTFTANAGGYPFLNGFQIVPTVLTPEPSSFALCGLGAAGLLLAARRRRSHG